MILGSLRLFRLLLFPLVLLPLSGAVKRDRRSTVMSSWTDPKYKKVYVPPELDKAFCSSDDLAPRSDSPQIRKEYHSLTDEERTRFHGCLQKMKNEPYMNNPGYSVLDMFIINHRNRSAPGAHDGPAFLPFHREYLCRLEKALNDCHPKCSLPYWDSSLDSFLPNPSDSAIFSEDYLGTSFGVITTGFMAHWKVVPEDCQEMGTEVTRECGNDGTLLMTDDKVDRFLRKKTFTDVCVPYDSDWEDDHGSVHAYVGGHMMSLTCAPNDVAFYMHHAFIDCCWEKYREQHPGSDNPNVYPDDNQVPQYHLKEDPMRPFYEKKNVDGLSNDYTKFLYTCEATPKKCSVDAQCRSKILWCDQVQQRCKAKVVEKGECTGLPDKACFCPGLHQAPQCVMLYDVGKCQCNRASREQEQASQEQASQEQASQEQAPQEQASQEQAPSQRAPPQRVRPRCQAPRDCPAVEWCDRATGQCRRKVELHGDCRGLPRVACSGTCVLPEIVNCVNGQCKCTVQRCNSADAECITTALWCNVPKKRCDRKFRIGDKCYGLPDNSCSGKCNAGTELKCQGTCQCVPM